MSKSFSQMKRNTANPVASPLKRRPGRPRKWGKSKNVLLDMDSFRGDPLSERDMRIMLIAATIERRELEKETNNRGSASVSPTLEEKDWPECTEKQREIIAKGLFRAIQETDVKKLSSFLKRGVPVDMRNEFGDTILMQAAGTGNIPLLEEILKHNPDIEARSRGRGDTAVMCAAESGKTKAVLFLHNAGAKLDARNNGKKTSLMLAAWEGHLDTVAQLRKLGANPRLKDSSNRTALDYAKLEGHREVSKLLSSRK